MNRRANALLLCLLLLLTGVTACAPSRIGEEEPGVFAGESAAGDELAPVPVPEEQAGEAEAEAPPQPLLPNLERMMETIDALCGAPRPLGSEAEYQAALYLQGQLEAAGYLAELEPFPYDITGTTLSQRYRQARELTGEAFLAAALPGAAPDGQSQNVVGRQPGEEALPILVLSAHYDSTPDSIGVVDNAAGVAVVLEAARLLAGEEFPFALRVVFFGGEEEILIGSRQHLLGLSPAERERIVGNITVDTLGYSAAEEFVALTPLLLEPESAEALAQASPVAAALLADGRVAPAFRSQLVGDHLAFATAGIDSVNFGQSMDAVVDLINSPRDNHELLEPALLPVAAGLLADAVRELAAGWEEEAVPPNHQ